MEWLEHKVIEEEHRNFRAGSRVLIVTRAHEDSPSRRMAVGYTKLSISTEIHQCTRTADFSIVEQNDLGPG